MGLKTILVKVAKVSKPSFLIHLRRCTEMPSTARASHKHQNECTQDEILFIPAFARYKLRSAGDADADEVEFEG